MSSPSLEMWWILFLSMFTIILLVAAFVISLVSNNRRLKKERDFSTNIVDTNPALIVALDSEGRIIRFNKSCELFSGYRSEEVLGRSFREFPLVREGLFSKERLDADIQPDKFPIYFESQWITREGKKCTIAWSTVEFDELLGQIKWILTGVDITERKRIEAELNESRMRLELALDGSMGGVWDMEFNPLDPPDTLPDQMYLSPKLKRLLGYEDHEFPSSLSAWNQKIIADDLPRVRKKLNDHLKGKSDLFEVQYRIYHKEHDTRWILSRGKIKRNERGVPVRWTGINWDITKRKQAEEALHQSEERLRTVMEKIPSGVGLVIDGKIEYSNPTLCNLTGFSANELAGKSPLDFIDPKDREKAKMRMEEVLNGGEEFESEYSAIDRHGKNIPIEVDSRKIFLNNKIGILAIIRDISERKKADEALNKYHEQLQQLSSHLQSVREEERTRISREIHDELGQALSILLIDISWLGNHRPKKNELPKKLNAMSHLVESTIKKIQKISSELRPSVLDNLGLIAALEWQAKEFVKKTNIPCKVYFSNRSIKVNQEISTAIFRIFQEALTNVIRHAKATEVRASLVEKESRLLLEINDNGIGISERDVSNPKSFGLLGIKERARSLNGDFEINGTPNKGTTLTVSIPLISETELVSEKP